MSNLMVAGNWYTIWSLYWVAEKFDENGECTERIPYIEVVISDDDKTRSYKIECSSKDEADSMMRSIADDLRAAQLPLWDILSIPQEKLDQRMLDYELLRLKYYHIPY